MQKLLLRLQFRYARLNIVILIDRICIMDSRLVVYLAQIVGEYLHFYFFPQRKENKADFKWFKKLQSVPIFAVLRRRSQANGRRHEWMMTAISRRRSFEYTSILRTSIPSIALTREIPERHWHMLFRSPISLWIDFSGNDCLSIDVHFCTSYSKVQLILLWIFTIFSRDKFRRQIHWRIVSQIHVTVWETLIADKWIVQKETR